MTTIQRPEIVGEAEWRAAHEALLAKEKAATRARDALAAERRRQPMVEIPSGFEFDGPHGRVGFLDLFEGRPQLIAYHFMFEPGGEPCGGCSMFTDQVSHLAHFHARDTSFALVSPAPQGEIAPFKARMGWDGALVLDRRRRLPGGVRDRRRRLRAAGLPPRRRPRRS